MAFVKHRSLLCQQIAWVSLRALVAAQSPPRVRRVCSALWLNFSTCTNGQRSARPMTQFTSRPLVSTHLPANLLAYPWNGKNLYKTAGFASRIQIRIGLMSWRWSSSTKGEVAMFGIRWATPPSKLLHLHLFQVRCMPPTLGHRRLSTRLAKNHPTL